MAFVATGGAVLAAISVQLHAMKGDADVGPRMAAIALQLLGLSAREAERVAKRSLPEARIVAAVGGTKD